MRQTIWTRNLAGSQYFDHIEWLKETNVLSLYGLLCMRMRPKYPTTSQLQPRSIAVMKDQVLYLHPRNVWPNNDMLKIPVKAILAAIFGA